MPFHLYAYCLMPNHFHLLIEVQEVPLSILMQRLLTSYTVHFNRLHEHKGHLFQGRYKAFLCDKTSYLLELVRYLHLNPVRANLVKSPHEWKWSAHNAYMKGQDSLATASFVLNQLSPRPAKAIETYARFVREGMASGHRQDLYPEEKIPYVGNESFIVKNKVLHEELNARKRGLAPPKRNLEDMLVEFSEKTGTPADALRGGSRERFLSKMRKLFVEESYHQGHRAVDIAHILNRTPQFVTKVARENASDNNKFHK